MSSWLASLPHQIPFRAASAARQIDQESAEGLYLCSAGYALAEGGGIAWEILLVEAMAQVAGMLAFGASSTPGFLSAVDEVRIDEQPQIGDRIVLRVRRTAEFGRIFRFEGVAERDQMQIGRAKFYLAGPE